MVTAPCELVVGARRGGRGRRGRPGAGRGLRLRRRPWRRSPPVPVVAAVWALSLATRAPRPIPVDTDATPMSAVARRTRDRARSRAVAATDRVGCPSAGVGSSVMPCPFGWLGSAIRIRRHTAGAGFRIPDRAIGQSVQQGQLRSSCEPSVSSAGLVTQPAHRGLPPGPQDPVGCWR